MPAPAPDPSPAASASADTPSGRLEALMAAARAGGGEGASRGPAPVEMWNPPDCGEIDMVIRADGTWTYMGTPIARPALVKLFASVLTREGERFVLKTPAEKVGIKVEDAPFLAVDMAVEDLAVEDPAVAASPAAPEDAALRRTSDPRTLVFRTNLDDIVRCGPGHELRFARGMAPGEVIPYLHVRRGLEARLSRSVHLDLMDRGEVRDAAGTPMFGVESGGLFFPIVPAAELGLD